MGYSTFGNRGGGSGDSPFYKIKRIPLINRTNVTSDTDARMSVWRAAAANNEFSLLTSSTLNLRGTNSSGVATSIATLDVTTYSGSTPTIVGLHLNTAAQCMYVLIRNSLNELRLIKMDDTTGVHSAVGSLFTPTTPARWPASSGTAMLGLSQMWVDGGGHLRIQGGGYYHQLNTTTGSVVTQDTALVIGSFNTSWVNYVTTDGATGIGGLSFNSSVTGREVVTVSNIVNATSGHFNITTSNFNLLDDINYANEVMGLCTVDDDKLFIGVTAALNTSYKGYVYRSEFDLMLQSIVDWQAG